MRITITEVANGDFVAELNDGACFIGSGAGKTRANALSQLRFNIEKKILDANREHSERILRMEEQRLCVKGELYRVLYGVRR